MSKMQVIRRQQSIPARLEIVSQMYLRQHTIRQIQSEVKVRLGLSTYSLSTVMSDIKRVLKELQEQRLDNLEYAVQLELERIDSTCRELWEQWEKSKETRKVKTKKRKGAPVFGSEQSGGIKTTHIEEKEQEAGGLGDPRYIAEIRQQLAERRKLLGLYAATKTEVTGRDGTPLIPAEKMTEEEITAEIEKIRASRNS